MPVHEETNDIAQADANTNTAFPYASGRVTRSTVLLLEDDKALRRYLEFTLSQAGYEVIPAADGLEGMKIALSSSVDIVVTDAMMPHLNGHEFCRFLRNSPHLSHIPIVMLSGSDPEQAGMNQELADVFLSKPMSAEQLTSCLEELLRRS
ncbi:MAG TPA: response regulator [Pyrinomonadaceae bacterium]|nr:response regulator [Pyrinomonadaceae bacterium]